MKINKFNLKIIIPVILSLIFLMACQKQNYEDLVGKVDSIGIGFSDSEDAKKVLADLTEQEKEKFMSDLQVAAIEHFDKNKDFEIKKTLENVLEENNISLDKVNKFKKYIYIA